MAALCTFFPFCQLTDRYGGIGGIGLRSLDLIEIIAREDSPLFHDFEARCAKTKRPPPFDLLICLLGCRGSARSSEIFNLD
jgi:hypothetical protein